jgi:hypothetical protein
MKKTAIRLLVLAILIALAAIGYANYPKEAPVSTLETTGSAEAILSGVVPAEVLPTTGSISVEFEAQPTKLAGNYTDNGTILRAWAEKNKAKLLVPAEAKNIRIGFVFAKTPKNDKIPGNLQLSLNGKNFCNGRLTNESAQIDLDTDTYWYSFNNVSTQDKPKGVDLTPAIGKELGIKVWIGENKNYVESVVLLYDL